MTANSLSLSRGIKIHSPNTYKNFQLTRYTESEVVLLACDPQTLKVTVPAQTIVWHIAHCKKKVVHRFGGGVDPLPDLTYKQQSE